GRTPRTRPARPTPAWLPAAPLRQRLRPRPGGPVVRPGHGGGVGARADRGQRRRPRPQAIRPGAWRLLRGRGGAGPGRGTRHPAPALSRCRDRRRARHGPSVERPGRDLADGPGLTGPARGGTALAVVRPSRWYGPRGGT